MSVPWFWPLPNAELIDDREITAADIADYLGESRTEVSEAIERPLFHKNRRAALAAAVTEVAEEAPVAPIDVFTLELVGIMGTNSALRTAFLLDAQSGQTHAVKTDQILNGWSIVEITPDSVFLMKGLEQKMLSLN
ncbi:unnamed protein product [Ectocarpus sp. 13 AM-2016]